MVFFIWLAIAVTIGTWILRRLFPAAFAAVLVVLAPAWLAGGLLHDVLRVPLSYLRPLGTALARVLGFVLVLPMLPFIFAWSFLANLRKKPDE